MSQRATRRAVSVGVAASVAFVALGAVGAGAQTAASRRPALSGSGKTIVVTSFVNGGSAKGQQEWHQYLQSQFHKMTGANVTFDSWTSTSQELQTLEQAAVTNSGPDIFNIGSSFTPTAWSTGVFQPLTAAQWKAVGGKQRFYLRSLTMSGPSANQQFAVPITTGSFEMLYNKALFAKAGIKAPPTTWNQFIADATKITNPKAGIYGTAIDPQDPYDPWHTYWLLTQQMGQQFISPNLKSAEVNTPKVAKAVEFYFDFLEKFHIVNPNSLTWKGTDSFSAFANGKVGMLLMQNLGDYKQLQSVPFKWGFANNPSIPYGATKLPPGGKPADSYVIGQYYGIAKYSPNKALDLKFVQLYTSTAAQLQMQRLTGNQPVNVVAGAAVANKQPVYRFFIRGEEASYPTPFTGAWGDFEVAIATATANIASAAAGGKYSPALVQQELAKANSVFQAHLAAG